MPTVSQDIRGAIQIRAATASGFPASGQRAYEGLIFRPTIGTAWAQITIAPSTIRPFDLAAARRTHKGVAIISVHIPTNGGVGTAAAEVAGDNVRAVFAPGTRLFQGSERVDIDFCERKQAIVDPDWISCPVEIAWTAHSSRA